MVRSKIRQNFVRVITGNGVIPRNEFWKLLWWKERIATALLHKSSNRINIDFLQEEQGGRVAKLTNPALLCPLGSAYFREENP
jgi:hypothetical protein